MIADAVHMSYIHGFMPFLPRRGFAPGLPPTETKIHREDYTQKPLHREAFTQSSFYTGAFAHRRFYI